MVSRMAAKGRPRILNVVVVAIGALGLGGCLLLSDLLLGIGIVIPPSAFPNNVDPYLATAREHVALGDERQEAIKALSDSWYHSECAYPSGSFDDLFFYGPKEFDKVRIVVVNSRLESGRTTVHFVGLIESSMVHLYERCIPSPTEAIEVP
jgi:hypothetical protein